MDHGERRWLDCLSPVYSLSDVPAGFLGISAGPGYVLYDSQLGSSSMEAHFNCHSRSMNIQHNHGLLVSQAYISHALLVLSKDFSASRHKLAKTLTLCHHGPNTVATSNLVSYVLFCLSAEPLDILGPSRTRISVQYDAWTNRDILPDT